MLMHWDITVQNMLIEGDSLCIDLLLQMTRSVAAASPAHWIVLIPVENELLADVVRYDAVEVSVFLRIIFIIITVLLTIY